MLNTAITVDIDQVDLRPNNYLFSVSSYHNTDSSIADTDTSIGIVANPGMHTFKICIVLLFIIIIMLCICVCSFWCI